jgi:hypothetical protein
MLAPIWTLDDAFVALTPLDRLRNGRRPSDACLRLDQILAPGEHILGQGACAGALTEARYSAKVIRLFR